MPRPHRYSAHALQRARERFPVLKRLPLPSVVQYLEEAFLKGQVVLEEMPGFVIPTGNHKFRWQPDPALGKTILRSDLRGESIEFVVAPRTGAVLTVIDPNDMYPQP